jgi:hypothetical protein
MSLPGCRFMAELTLRFHGGILGQEETAVAGMPESRGTGGGG